MDEDSLPIMIIHLHNKTTMVRVPGEEGHQREGVGERRWADRLHKDTVEDSILLEAVLPCRAQEGAVILLKRVVGDRPIRGTELQIQLEIEDH
jgi:hypothetical protein